MSSHDDLELTPAERAKLAELSREKEPAASLEDRVVHAVQRDGFLFRRPWYRRSIPVPLAAAAGFVLFALGAIAGRIGPGPGGEAPREPPGATTMRVREAPPGGRLVTWM
jgi:hypothetical protein